MLMLAKAMRSQLHRGGHDECSSHRQVSLAVETLQRMIDADETTKISVPAKTQVSELRS